MSAAGCPLPLPRSRCGRPHKASLTLQVAYVKREKETAGVTGVIRIIKRWVKLRHWRSGRAVPKSYCIELLVIHAKGLSST